MSDINDLHNEVKMLPVKNQTETLAEQFVAGDYRSHGADLKPPLQPVFVP